MARLLYILLLVSTTLLIRNGAFGQGSFQLRVAGERFSAVDEFVGNVQACVELTTTNPLTSNTTVSLETMDGSAIGPDDYTILSEQLTFISGSTSGVTMCRDIQIQQDNLSENIETFDVILTVDSSSQTVTVIIFDDDDGVVIGLEESVYSVVESDSLVTVCAVLQPQSVALGREVRFSFVAQDGSASSSLPRDYNFAVSEHSFSPTISRVCRNISIVDDILVEDTEFFTVSLESANDAMVNGSASVQITDNDAVRAQIMFERTSYTVREDLTEGKNLNLVACAIAEELTQAVTVTISTTNGTAIEHEDFVPVNQELIFDPDQGNLRQCICISIADDSVLELDEQFSVGFSSSDPVMFVSNSASVIIRDNDSGVGCVPLLQVKNGPPEAILMKSADCTND